MKAPLAAVLLAGSLFCLGCAANTTAPEPYIGKFAADWDDAVAKLNPVAGALDVEPVPIFRPQPAFPYDMRRKGVTGTATVEFIIGRRGQVAAARAVEADAPEFAQAAVNAVRRWRFEPAEKDGVAVSTRMRTTLSFGLTPEG